MKNKSKIIIFVLASAISMSAYVSLYYHQFGRGVVAEWWLRNVTDKKLQIANENNGERVFLIAGSNGIFGFDSKLISNQTGRNVINLSMHAGLDLSYYRMLIDKVVQKGDIVVMPLEFSYYSRTDEYTGWFVDNIIAWGYDYLKWNTLWKKIEFFSHVSLARVIEGFYAPLKVNFDDADTVEKFKKTDEKYYGYSYKSLNNKGDIIRVNFTHPRVKDLIDNQDKNRITLSYGKGHIKITQHTQIELKKIKDLVESRGASLYVSWPTTMQTKFFNADDKESKLMIQDVKYQLSSNGFSFLCDPFYANLPQSFFFDTHYHLNGDGVKIRSERFSQCMIEEIIKGQVINY